VETKASPLAIRLKQAHIGTQPLPLLTTMIQNGSSLEKLKPLIEEQPLNQLITTAGQLRSGTRTQTAMLINALLPELQENCIISNLSMTQCGQVTEITLVFFQKMVSQEPDLTMERII